MADVDHEKVVEHKKSMRGAARDSEFLIKCLEKPLML